MKLLQVTKTYSRRSGGSISSFIYKINPSINYLNIDGGNCNVSITPYYSASYLASTETPIPLDIEVIFSVNINLTKEQIETELVESIETLVKEQVDLLLETTSTLI